MYDTTPVSLPVPLPSRIERLGELAHNLWWTWEPDAGQLFSRLDVESWQSVAHNPIKILQMLSAPQADDLAHDGTFTTLYDRVCAKFDAYMQSADRAWYPRRYPDESLLVAYFCAEYGLHESLPIYSGGLGVLAGDHCKTASDLGLPFVAVGLWYTQGFFRQIIDSDGQQIAAPDHVDQRDTPLVFAGKDGADLIIEIPCSSRAVFARVWRLQVGRVSVYLLDVDIPENSPADRALCARLYGGDKETRIAQEIVLGVGGVRALRALGLAPTLWHMNEGHAGFMAIERCRELVQSGIPFEQARGRVAGATLFTTHTPVPAGNEVFQNDLVLRYLPFMPAGLGLEQHAFLALGGQHGAPGGEFAMTPLALRMADRSNGVSKLHGAVARQMWVGQFDSRSVDDVPITWVTNGVHTATWIAPELAGLFARYLGADWLEKVDDLALWDRLDAIPDKELWAVHTALKERMLAAASALVEGHLQLNPKALTIGFARRFATYKRATLFFHDRDRAARILQNPDRPVQLVFAGKAHPADGPGQFLIKSLAGITRSEGVADHVVLLPSYDMSLAQSMVQGVDVWLNNPERPQEASGTSGEKAALNGIPNCSIRDGWWDEGYNGRNGWAFGGEVGNHDVDSSQLYEVLENEVIPAYFERDKYDLPRRWITIMKETIKSCAPTFSAQRMLKEYTERLYR